MEADQDRAIRSPRRLVGLLGPAFVASVVYVDPGNVAANLSAGAQYGYLLTWVLVASSLMAMLIQFLSAKLGLVTGMTLSGLISGSLLTIRHGTWLRGIFAVQAVIVAIATDLAEVMGGALALHLLFGLPWWLGGTIVGVISIMGLGWLRSRGERFFDVGITMVLSIIAVGFLAGLIWAPPDPVGVIHGMVPKFAGGGSIALAASMLGATVMPHAIYLHSNLAIDRHRPKGKLLEDLDHLLFVQKVDVGASLVLSGTVNVAMLLFGVTVLYGVPHEDAILATHAQLADKLGLVPATFFAIGLLASSVGSAVVGTHAGAGMIHDLVRWRWHPLTRRLLTITPAVLLLMIGIDPTLALVDSQLVLSFGIAFALIPLALFTGSRRWMGEHVSTPAMRAATWMIVALVLALNAAVIAMSLG